MNRKLKWTKGEKEEEAETRVNGKCLSEFCEKNAFVVSFINQKRKRKRRKAKTAIPRFCKMEDEERIILVYSCAYLFLWPLQASFYEKKLFWRKQFFLHKKNLFVVRITITLILAKPKPREDNFRKSEIKILIQKLFLEFRNFCKVAAL